MWIEIGEGTAFFKSGASYYDVLWTEPAGNAYFILAHQFIAAQLNVASGATLGSAQEAFDAARALFEQYAPSEVAEAPQSLRDQFVELGGVLASYNEGAIGPGHCDYIDDPQPPM